MSTRYVREERNGIIGVQIAKLREKLGLSRKEVADQIHTNISNIYKWEKGYPVGKENLRRLGLLLANDSKYFFSPAYTKPIEENFDFIHG